MSFIRVRSNTRQISVGQGGLMLSQVVVDETNRTRQFAYAFDCGSVNREHLEQGLLRVRPVSWISCSYHT